jgi:hypothetical protein
LREHSKFLDSLPDDGEARHAISHILRAKTEPSIPEPQCGDGWEFCAKDEATEATCARDGWKPWDTLDQFDFDAHEIHYRFRRPIAKVAQWVACTAEEARENRDKCQWFHAGEWFRVLPIDECHTHFAYRTTAELSALIELGNDATVCIPGAMVVGRICGMNEVRRDSIPLGTVLG